MSETGENEALAAEFVLGTLDGTERAHAHALIGLDPAFAEKVRLWERRLGELHLMVEPIEPDPDIWPRIKVRMPVIAPQPDVPPTPAEVIGQQAAETAPVVPAAPDGKVASPAEVPPAMPEASPPAAAVVTDSVSPIVTESLEPTLLPGASAAEGAAPAAPAAASAPAPPSSLSAPSVLAEPDVPATPTIAAPAIAPAVVDASLRLRRKLRRWRALATLLLLMVLAAAGLVAAWKYAPEQVPPRLHPVELLRLVGITVATAPPGRPPAPAESQYDE